MKESSGEPAKNGGKNVWDSSSYVDLMGVSIHDVLLSTINFDFLGKYLLFPKILGPSIWGFVAPDVWCGVSVDKTRDMRGISFLPRNTSVV